MGQKEGKHRYVIFSDIITFPSVLDHFTYSLKYNFCFLIALQTERVVILLLTL